MPRLGKRFWSRVNKVDSGCWLWHGKIEKTGYGRCWYKGKAAFAHRVAYELTKGMIPQGLQIDHLCRNHACVNPAHLEVVTPRENTMRGLSPGLLSKIARLRQLSKIHCPKGHSYDLINTYFFPDGRRGCRTCMSRQRKEYIARQNYERDFFPRVESSVHSCVQP